MIPCKLEKSIRSFKYTLNDVESESNVKAKINENVRYSDRIPCLKTLLKLLYKEKSKVQVVFPPNFTRHVTKIGNGVNAVTIAAKIPP